MEQQQFIDHLIALKKYYQKLIEEYERQVTHANEQIEHVNSLLLDQFERQHSEQSADRRSQNNAVGKSLVNQLTSSTQPRPTELELATTTEPASTQSSSSQLADLVTTNSPAAAEKSTDTESRQPQRADDATKQRLEQSAIPEKLEPVQALLTQDLLEVATEASQMPVDVAATPEPTVQKVELATPEPTEPAPSKSVASEPVLESSDKLAHNVARERSQSQQLELPTPNAQKQSRYVPPLKTPLLPQYQHFTTKAEAVEKFLQDNEGKNFSIDEITRAIHGDLEPEAIRAERPRIYATLNKGVNKSFWQAVPDAPNYYTFNLNSDQPQEKAEHEGSATRKNQVKEQKFRGKPATGVLPRYQNLSWSQAVEMVVTEQVGQILTRDKVTQLLCGDLSGEALKQAKGKINKTLWSGANQGLWQRVPGQVGQYTLNLDLLNLKSSETSF